MYRAEKVKMNFISHLKPTLFICKLLGIVYFSEEQEDIYTDIRNFLLSLPLFSTYCCFFYLCINELSRVSYEFYNDTAKIGDIVLILVSVTNMMIRPIWSLTFRRPVKYLLRNINITSTTYCQNSFTEIVALVCAIIFNSIIDSYMQYTMTNQSGVYLFITFSINFYVGFVETFYIHKLVYEILKQFCKLNQQFSIILLQTTNTNGILSKEMAVENNKWVGQKIMQYSRIHYKLIKTARLTNNIFSFLILISIGANFGMFVVAVHFTISSVTGRIVLRAVNWGKFASMVFPSLIWSILTTMHISFIIWTWNTVSNEVRIYSSCKTMQRKDMVKVF